MPTETSRVGALTIPITAGTAPAAVDDPFLDGLLSFLAHYIKEALDTRLANVSGYNSDACPAANRFAFSPYEREANFVVRHVPALYLWWDGRSVPWNPSIVQKGRERNVHAMYVFEERPKEAALDDRRGVFNAVDAAFAKASRNGYHPTWSYNSRPLGTPLDESWDAPYGVEWEWLGGQGVQRIGIDDANTRDVGRRVSGRDYPAFVAMFRVRELIEGKQLVEPDDVLRDYDADLYEDGVQVKDGILTGPDGSEDQEP
jgi:hypothetical protein